MTSSVVVVGSCNVDLISCVPTLPRPGETLHGTSFSMGTGGKGANQCIMAAKLGSKAAMIAKVGEDLFSQMFFDSFDRHRVNRDHVLKTDKAMTGVAPIAVDAKGDNSIIIVAGANMHLTGKDIIQAEKFIKNAKVVVCQLEINPEVTHAALTLASKSAVKTIFNPAPAVSTLDETFFKNSYVVCPNETETELITGEVVNSVESASAALPKLLAKGCYCALITLGKLGCVFATKDDSTPVHVPAPIVKAVDSTGAGDAFIGSLAFYLAEFPHLSLKEMIRRACEIASVSVQAQGTQCSFPTRDQLNSNLFYV